MGPIIFSLKYIKSKLHFFNFEYKYYYKTIPPYKGLELKTTDTDFVNTPDYDELVEDSLLIERSIKKANDWRSWSKASRSSKDLLDHQENNDLESHLKLEQ